MTPKSRRPHDPTPSSGELPRPAPTTLIDERQCGPARFIPFCLLRPCFLGDFGGMQPVIGAAYFFIVPRVMRVTGKTPMVAGERLKLVVTAVASSIWGSWRHEQLQLWI
ncbi:uncharacterized protein [Lolium perenne]|uniref:uncharacterized protein n=1 Tax=Lolium perenne TaxID=4522 RepID=UPI0021F54C8E|nr:uncharacterized protein LOC127345999 isoform X1 [Lolium perenne]